MGKSTVTVKLFLCCCFLTCINILTFAQDNEERESQGTLSFFSLTALLQTARNLDVMDNVKHTAYWQPDWPSDIPFDVFSAQSNISPASILYYYNYAKDDNDDNDDTDNNDYKESNNSQDAAEHKLKFSRSNNGNITEFPFLLNGVLCQIKLNLDKTGKIIAVYIDAGESEDSSIEIEMLDFDSNDEPTLARVNSGGTWYFITFNNSEHIETWMDESGTAQALFNIKTGDAKRTISIECIKNDEATSEYYYYDSMGNITGIKNGSFAYQAAYNAKGLQYWQRPAYGSEDKSVNSIEEIESPELTTEYYRMQWNDKGMLVRSVRTDSEDIEIESVYDYTFDKNGNWIERRETKYINLFGNSIPQESNVCKRIITY